MREDGTDVGRPGAVPVLTLHDGLTRRPLGRGADLFASVHEAYLSGHTVIIETAEMWFGSINRFCRAMIAYFDYDFTLSLFLTPPDRPAFAPQSSSADMFVLQVRGASKWSLNGAQPSQSIVSLAPTDRRCISSEDELAFWRVLYLQCLGRQSNHIRSMFMRQATLVLQQR